MLHNPFTDAAWSAVIQRGTAQLSLKDREQTAKHGKFENSSASKPSLEEYFNTNGLGEHSWKTWGQRQSKSRQRG